MKKGERCIILASAKAHSSVFVKYEITAHFRKS